MKIKLIASLFLICLFVNAQESVNWRDDSFVFNSELLIGKMRSAHPGFPKTSLQKQLNFNFGRDHANNPHNWAKLLDGPRTGLSLGITEFGQMDYLGIALTAIPFMEIAPLSNKRWKLFSGLGVAYQSKKYHPEKNPVNQAVSTNLSWVYRLNLYYELSSNDYIDWRIGGGLSHHSNGHTRLMNVGYNSLLIGLSADIHPKRDWPEDDTDLFENFKNLSVCEYFSFRAGLGQNVFGLAFNDRRNVYGFSGEFGRIYNNSIKVGMGAYYRFYEHYYDYIVGNESLVQKGREFHHYQSNPRLNASNFGISLNGELLLNHVGVDLQLGINVHKPGYKLDWRINHGWANTPREIGENWVLGEFDRYYYAKRWISTRLGIKYYLIGNENNPRNNFYAGAFVNGNMTQADFTELAIGYIYRLDSWTRN